MPALALAALLALALAACGGGEDTGSTTGGADSTAARPGDGSGESPGGSGGAGGADREDGSGGSGGSGSPGSGSSGSGGGSGGSGSGDGSSGGSGAGAGSGGAGSGGGSSGGSSGGAGGAGAKDFRVPGGDNSVQEFGAEASPAETAQASRELEKYMAARAAENQEAACAALSATAKSQLGDLAQAVPGAGSGDPCVAIFTAIDKRTPPSARANTMTGPIGSLRVEGDRGFALYHGTEDTDYTINMEREGGVWKVAALIPYAL